MTAFTPAKRADVRYYLALLHLWQLALTLLWLRSVTS